MGYNAGAENYTDGDIDTNRSDNPTLTSIVDARYSRRQALFGGASAATMAVFGGGLVAACGGGSGGTDDFEPKVSAGQTGQSASGRVVTLSGTATDDRGISRVAWTQVSGPTVTLTGADTNTATFLAPSVAASTPLVFRFSAADSQNQISNADTTVNIDPASLGFTAVPKSLDDLVKVPAGYTVTVLYRLGDPLERHCRRLCQQRDRHDLLRPRRRSA